MTMERESVSDVVLTDRELAVVRGIAQGKSYRVIAEDLSLNFETVRTRAANVRKKLGLSKAGIAAWAVRNAKV